MSSSPRWPTPWVFSLLILPLGIIVGFNSTPLPFLLANAGVPVDRIAHITSLVTLPGALVFLWAPLADIKLRRRTWLAISIFATASFVVIYFPLIGAAHVTLMTALVLAGGLAASLILAACGGLMTKSLSPPAQAKASAWWQAGFLGGGALGGAAVLWLAARLPLFAVGLLVAGAIVSLGFLPFTIKEAPPLPGSWFEGRLTVIGRELWEIARTPQRRWSALLLISPGGTGAALYLLPAIASHYSVGGTGVMWINGFGGGLLLALGALSAALVPGNWDRRLMYAVAGGMNACATLVLLATNRPAAYLAGCILYLLTNGFCQAWFVALIADIVGKKARDASTLFSALSAIGTLSTLYMLWVDGLGFRHFGTRGLLWTDAAGSLLVCAIVISVFLAYGLGLRRSPEPSELQAKSGIA